MLIFKYKLFTNFVHYIWISMKNNYERIDEFNANHKGENGESTVATNF
jgi:hypothetical protein